MQYARFSPAHFSLLGHLQIPAVHMARQQVALLNSSYPFGSDLSQIRPTGKFSEFCWSDTTVYNY